LQQLDSSFTERDYGASSFRQFVEMLQKAGILELKNVEGQLIVELPQAEEAAPVTDTLLRPEEALPAVYQALKVIDENDLWGQLDLNEVRNYVQRLEPEFDEHRYGFGQFAELLTYAQDIGLVRLEPDEDSVLRVLPGVQFTATRPMTLLPAAKASTEAAPKADEKPAAPKPRRRTYRRHSRKRTTPRHTPSV